MTIDLGKLKAVWEWTEDLSDELHRPEILPCKVKDNLGDCIARQNRHLLEEMKPAKMCIRCQARWHVLMALKHLTDVLRSKTKSAPKSSPDFS